MSILWEKHGIRLYDPEKTYEGYTLVDPFTSRDVWLMDMKGNYVHRWVMPSSPRNHGVILPNGHLLYATAEPLPTDTSDLSVPRIGSWGIGMGLVEVDWESNVVWKYVDKVQSHSFHRMKNGNTIFPRVIPVPDDMARRLKGGIPKTEDRGIIWTDGLHEVTPDGKIAWEWSAVDHLLDPDYHTLCPLEPRGDFTHMNSVEELPDGNILVGFRNIDTICIIEKPSGKVIWQWGRGEVSHQHYPTMLDNGNILLFDNGVHRKNDSLITYSRGVEVNPETNKIEWEYVADPPQSFYAALISGCQRFPNGNTLICEGPRGRVFEVTKDGEKVWEYLNPFYATHLSVGKQPSILPWRHSNALFRAYRYPPDFPGLKGKELNPEKLEWVNRIYGSAAYKN